MPGLKEVEYYLYGLWLLVRRSPRAPHYLDLTDRGAMRSFWSILWSAPAIVLSWLWWQMTYLDGMPRGTQAGALFFFRLALIELTNWLVPLVAAGLICLALNIGQRFSAIVFVTNWLALPVSYAYGALILLMIFLPSLMGLITLAWLVLTFGLIYALFRIVSGVCGNQPTTVTAISAAILIPAVLMSNFLERYLQVYPG